MMRYFPEKRDAVARIHRIAVDAIALPVLQTLFLMGSMKVPLTAVT